MPLRPTEPNAKIKEAKMQNKRNKLVLFAVLTVVMTFGLWPVAGAAPVFADDSMSSSNSTVLESERQPASAPEPTLAGQGSTEGQGAKDPVPAPVGGNNKSESGDQARIAAEAAEHTHDGVSFTEAWADAGALPAESGNYYLTTDVTITQTWEPADGTSLCLNGHTITADIANAGDGGCAIQVNVGYTFGLYDCGNGMLQPASDKSISAGVNSEGGATFNLYGGTIKGFAEGVMTNLSKANEERQTDSYGTFNMLGGTITGCTTHGVYVFSGTFNMKDGRITQNKGDSDGAGVYVQWSTFNMSGGEISNNVADRNGGGLYVYRTSDIAISGGSITGNSALGTGQAEGDEAGNGGGVYVRGHELYPVSILVTGGAIKDNSASKLGGGVYLNKYATLKVSGTPEVSGNTAADKASNVQIGDKPITVAGKLEDGASIGVTCASDSDKSEVKKEATTGDTTDTSVFTSGYKSAGNTVDPATYYSSDDEAYLVGWTEDSEEARLVTAYNVVVEEAKNGTVTASLAKAREGDTVTLAVTPSDGYRLKALTVLDANKKEVEVANNAFSMPASDVTVSATFETTHYAISFDANGGSGTMDTQLVPTGESAELTANKFTRSGYTFGGWNTAKDGSGTSYKDKETVTPSGDMTLYAQWTKNATASSGTTSSNKSSGSTLSKTADPTSAAGVAAALVAGVGAVCAGIRRRRR